jgi:hypothetical protein
MSEKPTSWIQQALSHGSSLGDRSNVSFNFWEGPFSGEPAHESQRVESIDQLKLLQNSVEAPFYTSRAASDQDVQIVEKCVFKNRFVCFDIDPKVIRKVCLVEEIVQDS